MFRALALAALLLPSAPAASRAAEAAEPYKVRVNLAFFVGPQRYSMTDINEGIAATNADFHSDPLLDAAGLELARIRSGFTYGVGIRVWPSRGTVIGFDYERLRGSTSASVPVSSTPGAPAYSAEVTSPAQVLALNLGRLYDWPSKAIRFGYSTGVSYYLCDGIARASFPGYAELVRLHSTGGGLQTFALADIALSSTLQLEAAFGYRAVNTKNLQAKGAGPLLQDVSWGRADHSGLITRIGLNIPFGPH
jgi:hypothetical protein